MGLPPSTKGLLTTDGKINTYGIMNGSCAKIFWPVTCLLLAKGTDSVIWAMPPWVYDDNAGFNQYTPKYFVPMIYSLLVVGMDKLYNR